MKFMTLILISTLALVLTQCTAKPAKRTHNNTVGIWLGQSGGLWEDGVDYQAIGVSIKHLNPKFISNSFFNANLGGHFNTKEETDVTSVEVGFNLLTDDLYMKSFWLDGTAGGGDDGAAVQYYIGPSLCANWVSKNGKPSKFNPTLGFSGGLLMLWPKGSISKTYPESDFSLNVGIQMKGLIMARFMHNLYLF